MEFIDKNAKSILIGIAIAMIAILVVVALSDAQKSAEIDAEDQVLQELRESMEAKKVYEETDFGSGKTGKMFDSYGSLKSKYENLDKDIYADEE